MEAGQGIVSVIVDFNCLYHEKRSKLPSENPNRLEYHIMIAFLWYRVSVIDCAEHVLWITNTNKDGARPRCLLYSCNGIVNCIIPL